MKDIAFKINQILSSYAEGNKDIAYKKLKKILIKYPNNEKIYFNLALMEQDQGLNEKAKRSYKKLIEIHNNYNAKINLYLMYIKDQDYSNALAIIEMLLEKELDNQKILLDKAYIYFKINELNKCLEICSFIISKEKENLNAINLIGRCLQKNKKYKEAEEKFLEGISYDKKDVPLLNSLGSFYFEIWKLNEAELFYKNALKYDPTSYQTLNNIAGYYLETNNSKNAEIYYAKAQKLMPNEPTILCNLAKTYFSMNKTEKAKEYCLMALKIRDEDEFKKVLSIIYFHELNFKKAWFYFDGRLGLNEFVKRNENYKLIKKKILKNKKINPKEKLLVIREQGVGDEILYGTIYKDLLDTYKNTIIEADERLIPLFKNSLDSSHQDKFVKLGYFSNNYERLKDINQVLYSGSLGYYFRNNITDFSKKNYIKIPNKEISEAKTKLERFKKQYKIGLSWKSFNALYSNQKSLNLTDFNFLIQSNILDFINLQYGDVDREIITFNKNSKNKIHTIENVDLFNDFMKIASILKNIDLFITVSNSTAHLAGALGVKTLLIKPFNQATFHYWNQPTNRTPWYESIELVDRDELENKELFEKKVISKVN